MTSVPPPASVRDWVVRIETAKGNVARRNQVQRALDALHEPAERRELLDVASKLELAAILGKVQALSSAAAKKHQLQKAIDQVRADNLPEELQDVELKQLEARLKELG